MSRWASLLAVLVFGVPAAVLAAPAPRDFHADLAAEWETKFTESPATGVADFHLDIVTQTFTWNISFKGLTGPVTAVRLHGPAQPGANGAAIVEIAPKGAATPLTGSAHVTAGQIQYLLYGWTYLNIYTDKYPRGEIRGQLDVRAPKESKP